MSLHRRVGVGLLSVLLGFTALGASRDLNAEGMRGSSKDRLDWPGSTTDRYLDGDEVAAVLGDATDQFAGCASLDEITALEGAPLWLKFSIDPQGRPEAQLPVETDTASPLYSCLLVALKALKFPEHDGAPGLYSYPIVLLIEEGVVRHVPYPVVLFEESVLSLPLLTLPPDLSQDDLEAIAAELLPSSP
jgi:hypothetical protein